MNEWIWKNETAKFTPASASNSSILNFNSSFWSTWKVKRKVDEKRGETTHRNEDFQESNFYETTIPLGSFLFLLVTYGYVFFITCKKYNQSLVCNRRTYRFF